ncbi:MAG TPA: FISUMP domain-containing protein [Ferruginibacter sp.]|nr:FISUMP domain-containing protein [Ferruginibacter sp.]
MKLSFVAFLCIASLLVENKSVAQNGSALNLDGVNDHVTIPHNLLLKPSSAITIEAWIKPSDIHTNTNYTIYRKEDGSARHLFAFQGNGTILSFGLELNGLYSELDVPVSAVNYEGQWIHVAATYDGSAKRMYRNGILIGTQVVNGLIGTAGSANVYIGSSEGDDDFFNGSIDELKLWNRALMQCEIENNMNCSLSGIQNGMIAYYNFNQGIAAGINTSVNILLEKLNNDLNGTLVNFALSGPSSNWISPGGTPIGNYCDKAILFISIASGTNPSCISSSLTFAANSVSVLPSPVYQWRKNGAILAGETNITYTTSLLNNNDTISCTVTSNSMCALSLASNRIVIEKSLPQYIFTGNGSWKTAGNWNNNAIPPGILPFCSEIIIDPFTNGECVIDTFIYIAYGAAFNIRPGKKLRIIESLKIFDPFSDTLTVQEDSVFAAAESRIFQLSDIYSPSLVADDDNQISKFRRNILSAAIALTDVNRPELNFPDEGTDKPAHKGLAYVSSGENYYAKWEVRYNNGSCTELLHGLECNGFVSRVMMDAGVHLQSNIRLTTPQFADTSILNKNLRASPLYNKIRYLPGVLHYDLALVKPGDIIFFVKPNFDSRHVGICCNYNGSVYVFQSNGTPGDCITNKPENKRGARAVKLSDIITWTGLENYYVLKLEVVPEDSFIDPRDGQVYTYKQIGAQVWMTKNLNYDAPGSKCYDNSLGNCNVFGRLYNWNSAVSLAPPPGWHLPSNAEWSVLTNFLGGDAVAGGPMKSLNLWNNPNTGATNSSGFSALPGGSFFDGDFHFIGTDGSWWTSTPGGTGNAYMLELYHSDIEVGRDDDGVEGYLSVRCVRD